MGGQFYYLIVNIIFEHILVGMWIIYKEDYFEDIVLKLGFSISVGYHIDTTSTFPKGG